MIMRAGIVAAILGLFGGFVGVWLGLNVFGHNNSTPHTLHEVIHGELSLSHEQEALIEALEENFSDRKALYDGRAIEARRAIGEALQTDHEMSEEVAAAATAFHDTMGEFQLETLNHILAMRAVMNDDQRAEFDARLAGAFDVQR
jgi:hypothetical protein